MMRARSQILVVGCVAVIAVIAVLVAARPVPAGRIADFSVLVRTTDVRHLNVPPKGSVLGDIEVSNGVAYDAQRRKRIGLTEFSAIVTSRSAAYSTQVSMTLALNDGQITLAGAAPIQSRHPVRLAITGGTLRYRNLGGEALLGSAPGGYGRVTLMPSGAPGG
jgi:hypothetical protein